VALKNCISEYKDVLVGTPQGTKLGPILWLFYINDFSVATGFNIVTYADDTLLYTAIEKNNKRDNASEKALDCAKEWSRTNNMKLNLGKTRQLSLSLRGSLNADVHQFKFLGFIIDENLNFNAHVQYILSKCQSRLFLMRKLKQVGMDRNGLLVFYTTNVRSILIYGCPAFYTLLSSSAILKLESVQRSATRIVLPEYESYHTRLEILKLSELSTFMYEKARAHFSKIVSNPDHTLFNRLTFNTCRRSSRHCSTFRPVLCRTEKRKSSFIQHFMSKFNE
jgi:hypothetical protein